MHALVQVGKEGISPGLGRKVKAELRAHELIKVRIAEAEDVRAVAVELAAVAEAELVQVIGKVVVLYRRRKEEPEIVLPG
jgi:RNA-binding protein